MTLVKRGKIEEVIYARLDPGADLLHSLWDVCKQEGVRTGVLLDCTGSMHNLRIQRWPQSGSKIREELAVRLRNEGIAPYEIDLVDIPGPLELSAHGIIGEAYAPGEDSPVPYGFEDIGTRGHGEPYLHIHLVASNAENTICGHLLEGSMIHGHAAAASASHFTVVIGKVSGVDFRAVIENTPGGINFKHTLDGE